MAHHDHFRQDLKPENFLFLTKADDAPIKIIDFGLSRHDDSDLGIMQTKVGSKYLRVAVGDIAVDGRTHLTN
jgi:serine/threonine protein kinase